MRLGSTGWTEQSAFASGIDSAPCLIEGTYGADNEMGVGNFELCVAVQGHVEHWWRWNQGLGSWTRSAGRAGLREFSIRKGQLAN